MLRKRAIRSLLVEEVAGLRPPASEDDAESTAPEAAGRAPLGGDGDPADSTPADDGRPPGSAGARRPVEALDRAERKALAGRRLDWLALVALFVLRDTAAPFLPMGATIETVFTLGILAVAVHSGFRLGQLEKYRAVTGSRKSCAERSPTPRSPPKTSARPGRVPDRASRLHPTHPSCPLAVGGLSTGSWAHRLTGRGLLRRGCRSGASGGTGGFVRAPVCRAARPMAVTSSATRRRPGYSAETACALPEELVQVALLRPVRSP